LKQLFLLSLLFLVIHLSAQTSWGKVSPEQFAVRHCPFDSTANAMVIIDSETISFRVGARGFETVYDVYKRIQIFNKEGFGYATVKIPYYSHTNVQLFEQLEAQTITNDETGKIQITKLKDNAFFDETESDYFSQKRFAFANVAESSIIEYRYTLVSKSVGDLNDWLFQNESMPTLRSSVTIKVPEYFHYSPTPQGGVRLNRYKTEPYNEWLGQANVLGNITYYMMMNIPALKKEAYITTINDYLARMVFPLNSITIPRQKAWVFSDTWDIVVQQLMKNEYFGSHLNELLGEQLGAAKDITQGLNTKEDKARAIYNLVQSKTKWNGVFSLYPSKRLSKTYTDGNGNSADINMLFISMLRAVDIKADPVLISTREHGMIQRAYPRNRQFDNVIVYAQLDTGWILLDAAEAFKPFELIGQKNLCLQGLRVVKNTDESKGTFSGEWIEIAPSKNSATSLMSTLQIDSVGGQKSKTILTASDYPAVRYREGLDKDSVREYLKEHLKILDDFDWKDEKADNAKDINKKLKLTLNFEKKDSATESEFLYVNTFPVKFLSENPFKLSKRTYPVDYSYPFQENILTTIVVPANYKVSELPKPVKIKLEDGSASFSFLIGQSDNNIQVNSSLKINKSQFQPDVYDDLKAFYEKMIVAYNSLIVLQKNK
jgi:transglutaminase-like putative cysteine protease